jgi:glycosyltransferase involved in cell wall biosynthesis
MTAVSAVIPVHNGAAYVAEAIGSVLSQTHPPSECLVIDDGSTDATPEVVARFGNDVRYVRLDRGGQSRARNQGTQLANGELVAFLDHDDMWLPRKLERQLEEFRLRPDAKMMLCAMEMVDASGRQLGHIRLAPREDLLTGMLTFDGTETPSCNSTGVMRRDWLLDNGGYDPMLGLSGDWDLLLRAVLEEGVAYVDEPLVRYRLHGSNLHRNVVVMERDMLYAFAKAFANPRLCAATQVRRNRAYGCLFRMLAGSYREIGDRSAMIRALALSIRHDPLAVWELARRQRRPK